MTSISASTPSLAASRPPLDGGTSTYVVKPGDTMTSIAKHLGVSLSALEQANPQVRNPNLIYPQQHLNVPAGGHGAGGTGASTAPRDYEVKSGDTLSGIGQKYGIDWHVLAQINHLSNPNLIFPGQHLTLGGTPAGGGGGTSGTGGTQGPAPTPGPQPAGLQGRIDQAMQYFESQGWSRAQAAGIVANLQAESGVDAGRPQDNGGPGYGLAQWEGPRQASFRQWSGHDIHGSSFQEQLQFVQYELTHTEAGAGNALRGATSASEAGSLVTRLYERPADTAGQAQYRAGLAQQIFNGPAP